MRRGGGSAAGRRARRRHCRRQRHGRRETRPEGRLSRARRARAPTAQHAQRAERGAATGHCRRRRHAAAAVAAAAVQLKLQSKLNNGPPPPDTNIKFRPTTAGQSWVRGGHTHPPVTIHHEQARTAAGTGLRARNMRADEQGCTQDVSATAAGWPPTAAERKVRAGVGQARAAGDKRSNRQRCEAWQGSAMGWEGGTPARER